MADLSPENKQIINHPVISPSLLQFIHQVIDKIEKRIPALEQSIKEIKLDWSL